MPATGRGGCDQAEQSRRIVTDGGHAHAVERGGEIEDGAAEEQCPERHPQLHRDVFIYILDSPGSRNGSGVGSRMRRGVTAGLAGGPQMADSKKNPRYQHAESQFFGGPTHLQRPWLKRSTCCTSPRWAMASSMSRSLRRLAARSPLSRFGPPRPVPAFALASPLSREERMCLGVDRPPPGSPPTHPLLRLHPPVGRVRRLIWLDCGPGC